jgi:hypothetical protein
MSEQSSQQSQITSSAPLQAKTSHVALKKTKESPKKSSDG